MKRLICYNCFSEFPLHGLHFKCIHHGVFPMLPEIRGFRPMRRGVRFLHRRMIRTPPAACACRHGREANGRTSHDPCYLLTSYRVCPECHKDLPHYLGLAPQRVVAVTGCVGSGKTVYQWSLLHQLRHSSSPKPFITCMFEDDSSFLEYERLHHNIVVKHRVPAFTKVDAQINQGIAPVVTRLFGPGLRSMANLIFYDPSGEFMEDMNKVRYMRYLAHASAIIYLVDPRDGDDITSVGLRSVANQISQQLGLHPSRKIQKPLAVALTKSDKPSCDELRRYGPDRLLLDSLANPAEYWTNRQRYETSIAAGSRLVEEFLRTQCGLNNLANIAAERFAAVRFFAVSSLGQQPDGMRLSPPVKPRGPENPLFWTLRQLGL